MTGKERADMNVEAIVVVIIIIVVIVIIMIKIIRFFVLSIKKVLELFFFSCDDPAFDPLKIPHFQEDKDKNTKKKRDIRTFVCCSWYILIYWLKTQYNSQWVEVQQSRV